MIKLLFFLVIGSWLVLGMLFLGYPTLQRLKDEDRIDDLGAFVFIPAVCAFVIGAVADIVFNATWGSVIFREPPQWQDKELLFTSRLKRHWRGDDPVQRSRAEPWVRRVNAIDPGHV